MKLLKPPIVQIWVEFLFDPNPNNSSEIVQSLLGEFSAEYPKIEIEHADTLEFHQVSPKELPKVVGRESAISHLRLRDEKGTKWIHIQPNYLVCSFLRLGDSYPGFSALSKDAVSKLQRFIELCKPLKVRHAAIHYVDRIDVPVHPTNREIQLSDYFTLGLDLPSDSFGNQLSYLMRTTLRPTDGTGLLDLQLQSEVLAADATSFRFRMDWHKYCPYDGEIGIDAIESDLRRAHESVMNCFRAAFTERAWKLFEPVE
jgi:uncharacterized protein (TIGR04255 family)